MLKAHDLFYAILEGHLCETTKLNFLGARFSTKVNHRTAPEQNAIRIISGIIFELTKILISKKNI